MIDSTFEGPIKPNVLRLIHAVDDDPRLGVGSCYYFVQVGQLL